MSEGVGKVSTPLVDINASEFVRKLCVAGASKGARPSARMCAAPVWSPKGRWGFGGNDVSKQFAPVCAGEGLPVSKCVSHVAMSMEIAGVSSSSCAAPGATDVDRGAGAGPSSREGRCAEEACKQRVSVSKGVCHAHGVGMSVSISVCS